MATSTPGFSPIGERPGGENFLDMKEEFKMFSPFKQAERSSPQEEGSCSPIFLSQVSTPVKGSDANLKSQEVFFFSPERSDTQPAFSPVERVTDLDSSPFSLKIPPLAVHPNSLFSPQEVSPRGFSPNDTNLCLPQMSPENAPTRFSLKSPSTRRSLFAEAKPPQSLPLQRKESSRNSILTNYNTPRDSSSSVGSYDSNSSFSSSVTRRRRRTTVYTPKSFFEKSISRSHKVSHSLEEQEEDCENSDPNFDESERDFFQQESDDADELYHQEAEPRMTHMKSPCICRENIFRPIVVYSLERSCNCKNF